MQSPLASPPVVPSDTKTILIVEDDDDIRSLLCAVMERDAHRVLEASDGEEALQLVGRAQPDLVLLDVHLPGIDGPEVCRMLRADAATRAVHVLMLTAATEADDRRRGIEAGADGYITKPFDLQLLLDQVGARLGTT
jgi:DNA-binding response OmpR family regulator